MVDYEAQYQMTTDYVTETFEQFNDIKRYWLCLPVGADCGCRMDAEELLRLKQLSGLQELFKDKDFSKSWE